MSVITVAAIWFTGVLTSLMFGFMLWLKVGKDIGELVMCVLAPVLLFTSLRLWFG